MLEVFKSRQREEFSFGGGDVIVGTVGPGQGPYGQPLRHGGEEPAQRTGATPPFPILPSGAAGDSVPADHVT